MANVNNRLAVVVAGSLGVLAVAWLGGVAVAAGGDVPGWAVLVAIGAPAIAGAVAWLLAKVSHGGDWAGGPGRIDRSGERHGGDVAARRYAAAGQRV